MVKADKNNQIGGMNPGGHDFPDDSEDFLDSLMEDVMGTNESPEDSVLSEPAPVSESGNLGDNFNSVNNESDEYTQVDNEETPVHIESKDNNKGSNKLARRTGLLNRFSSGAVESVEEVEKEIAPKVEEPVSNKGAEKTKETAQGSGRKGRGSLLSRIASTKNDEEIAEKTKENKDVFNDNSSSKEIQEEVPYESSYKNEQETEVSGNKWTPKFKSNTGVSKDSKENIWGNTGEDVIDETPKVPKSIPVEDSNEGSVSGVNDLLDDMLEGLEEEDDIEQVRINAELDPEVEVPLEKPGMDEIVVTADGRTLADMLPGLRAGNRSINKVISKMRNQEEINEVQGKKFADNRYTKHIEVIDKEAAEQEKRIALSMKFLQRNAEFTEQEKVIMRNLGLTGEQLSKVMKSKELTNKEKNEMLGLGRYGAERFFKGRRYRTTVGDTAMLEFIVKFKYANTRILRWISNEPQNRTWRKLNRLRDSGLVESRSIIGIPDLWGATYSGTAIAGYSLAPGLRPMPKIPTISSSMGVNYIAACLWFNTVNVLNLEDFPANNRIIALQDDGRDRVRGEMLVSELEIRSSLGKEINPSSTTMQTLGDDRLYDVISSNVRTSFEEWEDGGRVGDSPESFLGNEYMWVLFPTSQLTLSYHVPDLVVKRERGPNGEPRSIAVEMERYEKTNDRYDKIMLAYKLDEHLYERVIWITPNTRVARALEQAAEAVGFDRYSIIPIITETGVYDKQDIWMI